MDGSWGLFQPQGYNSSCLTKSLKHWSLEKLMHSCCRAAHFFFDECVEGAAALLCAWIHITQSRPITSLRLIQQIVLMDVKRLWERWGCWQVGEELSLLLPSRLSGKDKNSVHCSRHISLNFQNKASATTNCSWYSFLHVFLAGHIKGLKWIHASLWGAGIRTENTYLGAV